MILTFKWPSIQRDSEVLRRRIALASRAEFERRRLTSPLVRFQKRRAA